jgi:hypothetical protein
MFYNENHEKIKNSVNAFSPFIVIFTVKLASQRDYSQLSLTDSLRFKILFSTVI